MKENQTRMLNRLKTTLPLVALVILEAGCAPFLLAAPPTAVFNSAEISESSGIVKSRRHPDIFWTHNDSGDTARLFAIRSDGTVVGQVKILGAENTDWEDIAIDPQGRLYVCDTGNNRNDRDNLTVYILREPDPFTETASEVIGQIKYRFPGLNRHRHAQETNWDTEACFYAEGQIYLLTKQMMGFSTVYRLNPSKEEQVAEKITEYRMSGMVTGADVSSDEKMLAVLTYFHIYLFEKSKAGNTYFVNPPQKIDLSFGQAEGISFSGNTLLVTNEEGQLLNITLSNEAPTPKPPKVK